MAKARKKAAKKRTAKRKTARKVVRRKKAVKRKAVKRTAKKKTVKKTTAKRKPAKKAKKRRGGGGGLTKQKCSLSAELQEICKANNISRPEIMKRVWGYIKSHKCQDTKNRRMINPDSKLSGVIGNKSCDMLKLAGHISKHIRK